MGWTVLYIAFGIVALWLLGEVLLQYKARLRWRLLAFTGFLGVVIGVLLPSVLVIAVGAIAFAVGQTYVTLSFRRGFSTGWAIGGKPGASRRRRGGGPAPAKEPTLEVSDLEYEPVPEESAVETTQVYQPQPLEEDTGQYGVYSGSAHAGQQQPYSGYDAYSGYDQGAGQESYGQYGYGTGQQQEYTAYPGPYIGTNTQQYADPYAAEYGTDTPPGGVWVPQQRDAEAYPADPTVHQPDGGTGTDDQYRY
ncbi:hypothetical protein GCM10020367_16910 [Streptomyces sannanensis]|uniref:Uncharacterized protein n=1 Tax=Streptomyces sannanensis TaxID=285536 RepID=A0ABP6S859_9ACTN